YGPWGLVKLDTPVRYPPVLQLEVVPNGSSCATGTAGTILLNEYALDAVVHHLGTAFGGHFVTHRAWHAAQGSVQGRAMESVSPIAQGLSRTAIDVWSPIHTSLGMLRPFARRRGDGSLWARSARPWVHANDERVAAATQGQALGFPGAYLFLYERCHVV
ncbi:unnamed protein product, partial [Polarella glacialis]